MHVKRTLKTSYGHNKMQNDIFSESSSTDPKSAPLAYKMRPTEKADYVGFEQLAERYPFLKLDEPRSMIIWGPPGSGKTTLVDLLCSSSEIKLFRISAVLSGVPELKKNIELALHETATNKRIPVIFIDEIHRFNKIQQDALLPHVESGHFVLIGATTENPKSSVNKALLSRVQLVQLRTLGHEFIVQILKSAMVKIGESFETSDLDLMAQYSNGDARKAIGNLETSINLRLNNDYTSDKLIELIKENSRSYDRNQDRHYDVISAFIKSLRGSDPDAAILWLSVMLDGGEDPVFIARRLVIFASEDVGNADINAISIANSAFNIVSNIGMPEARITLAQAAIYLASTVKSNACYTAINEALEYVKSRSTIEVPEHLKSHNSDYKYPHNYDEGWVQQDYTPEGIPKFYRPKQIGSEVKIAGRLDSLWGRAKDH
jgi:putative ATPase